MKTSKEKLWHHLAQHKELSLVELTNEPFVLATGGCHVHAASIMADAGLSLSDVRIEVRDWVSAVALVRAGEGISLVPESNLPENRKGLRVLPLNPPMCRQFGMMVPKHSTSRPATLMMELTKKRY
ncbi:LysR family transcriptional regulator substrate-binding protein [Vibrio ruber]|uniref:LysR family transcriptional regulator substrate-binding protein n=1 Tax=Vibrio ruber TaxID=184755 RepID=UPI0009875458|nr:LysR family transcriptional regulator substrate-binding protein [Vibrio ruber]